MRDQLQYNKTGYLEWYAQEGLPDADGDVTCYISGQGLLDSTNLNGGGNAIKDTTSATVTVAASRGATKINVDTIAGFVRGRSYVVVSNLGERQSIQLTNYTTGALYIDEPLEFDLEPTTSFVESNRLYVNLSTTNTSQKRRRMRALWEYAVDGITYRHTTYFDVVEVPFDIQISERYLEGIRPSYGEDSGARGLTYKLVRGAVKDIWSFLEGQGINPDLVRDTGTLKQAAAYRVLQRLYTHPRAAEEREEFRQEYLRSLDQFVSSKAWYDSDDDLTVDGPGGDDSIIIGGEEVYGVGGDSNDISGSELGDELGPPASYMRVG